MGEPTVSQFSRTDLRPLWDLFLPDFCWDDLLSSAIISGESQSFLRSSVLFAPMVLLKLFGPLRSSNWIAVLGRVVSFKFAFTPLTTNGWFYLLFTLALALEVLRTGRKAEWPMVFCYAPLVASTGWPLKGLLRIYCRCCDLPTKRWLLELDAGLPDIFAPEP